MEPQFRIKPLGDSAVTFRLMASPGPDSIRLFVRMRNQILGTVGIKDIVVAYNSITVLFDSFLLIQTGVVSPVKTMSDTLAEVYFQVRQSDEIYAPVLRRIPVCYDAKFAPDVEAIATLHQISASEVIALHHSRRYTVFMIGFLPGFPYLGFVDDRIATPRRSSPRQSVSKGSVGIADSQTGIYPLDSPGGWNIIGRTPLTLFDPASSPPVEMLPGDEVEFYPIAIKDFEQFTR